MTSEDRLKYDAFLEDLRRTARTWYFDEVGRIRCPAPVMGRCHCPITAIRPNDVNSCGSFELAGGVLGLPRAVICLVAAAADDDLSKHNRPVRRDLIEACGLKEEA